MIYSKTLNTTDDISESKHINTVATMLAEANIPHRFEHPHRAWEYGLAMHAIREVEAKTILDIGGGGSVFAPATALVNIDVTQIDLDDYPGDWIKEQEKFLGKKLPFIQGDIISYEFSSQFDAVTVLSVIEHLPNSTKLLRKIGDLVKLGGLLVLTTDFHPSGEKLADGHERTYNEASLLALAKSMLGFKIWRDEYDYTYHGNDVYNYTFASLILQKVSDISK